MRRPRFDEWIRIVFRCWQDRKPYDEQLYQQARARRRPPKANDDSIVELQWKNVAGFSKLSDSTP